MTIDTDALESAFEELTKVVTRTGRLAIRGRLDKDQIGTLADELRRVANRFDNLAERW